MNLDLKKWSLPDSKALEFPNPSKGIQCYTYICVTGCSIEISVPGNPSLLKTGLKKFTIDHLEVERKHTTPPFFQGVFRCRVLQNGHEVFNKWVEISALTGQLVQGNMKDMVDQTTVINNDLCITYSFYDAPFKNNQGGLPEWDQFYITVCPNCTSWMSTVAPIGSAPAARLFKKLVLPAAHDVGMNGMQTSLAILQRVEGTFAKVIASFVPEVEKLPVSDWLQRNLIPNIIQSAAITQKDTLPSILAVGARYFEFRPAHLHNAIRGAKELQDSGIEDKLYFMHGPIPGMAYDTFLANCVEFLVKNPGEIIVLQLRWDGVPAECAHPAADELEYYLNYALSKAQGALQVGDAADMNGKSIDQLRQAKKRLIVLQDADQYSIYSDQGNATLNGDSIIAQFEKISAESEKGKVLMNLQCQATATNMKQIWFSALTLTASSSWLLCTKAICDSKTMPWIRDKILGKISNSCLLIVMDDFVDGAMCDIARDLSIKRLQAT